MSYELHIKQNSSMGSKTTNIGQQNNFYGLTPQEACDLSIKLFYDNFPKLQEQANEIVKEKINELMDSIAKILQIKNIKDMSPFGCPDVQYITYEAQKNYARLGTKEMLNTLSYLVVSRIQHENENIVLKVSIDKAIEIAPILNSKQLDLLSLLFICTRVKNHSIRNIEDLKTHMDEISIKFADADFSSMNYLNMLGCLQLYLHSADKLYAEMYNLTTEAVKSICPEIILKTSGDYSTSYIGTVLAINNAELKMNTHFDLNSWIE